MWSPTRLAPSPDIRLRLVTAKVVEEVTAKFHTAMRSHSSFVIRTTHFWTGGLRCRYRLMY